MLLLDPLQMRGARQLAAPGTLLPTPGAVGDDPANVLENITDLIMAKEGIKASQRIGKPLAVVFTKMDALLHDFKETSPLLRPQAHTPYFDERDSLEVHSRNPAAAGPVGGLPDRSDRPEELSHLPLFRSIRARRDAHPGKIAYPRAASGLTG